MTIRATRALPRGEPLGWSHWRCAVLGLPELRAWEFGWYTDSWVIAQIDGELGPLQLLNPVARREESGLGLAIVARFGAHRPDDGPRPIRLRTDYQRYTAVDVGEELSGLFSLAMEVRCRSGGLLREFETSGDPRGRPIGYDHVPPRLETPSWLHGTQLPGIGGRGAPQHRQQIDLRDARRLLGKYPLMSHKKAIALVRAARLYSRALWIADADPEGAWLSLVSACEVAAVDRYGGYDPKFQGRRRKGPTPAQRFIDFIVRYASHPPDVRPRIGQVDWNQMRRHADWIYHWRSRALHDGIPFPPGMIDSPPILGDDGLPAEAMPGLGMSAGSSSWTPEAAPMLLHTFAFIAGQALRRWWAETPTRSRI